MPGDKFQLVEVPGEANPVQFPAEMSDDAIATILKGFTARNFALNPPGVQPPALRQSQGMQTEQIPAALKGFLPQNFPGAGEGANLAQPLGEYTSNVAGGIGGGVKNIAQGNVTRGTHEIIGGVGEALAPTLPMAAAAAPVATAGVLAGSYLGGKVAKYGASALGASPDQAALAEDVGNLATGYGMVKGAGGLKALTETPGTPAERLSAALGKNLPKAQWAKLQDRITAVGDKVPEVVGGAKNIGEAATRMKNRSLALQDQFSSAIEPVKGTDISPQVGKLRTALEQAAQNDPYNAASYQAMGEKVSDLKTLGQLDDFVAGFNKTRRFNAGPESLVRQSLTETVRGITGQDFSPLRLEQSHWMTLSRAAEKAAIPEQLQGLQSKVTSPSRKVAQGLANLPRSPLQAIMRSSELFQPSTKSLIRGIPSAEPAVGGMARSVAPEAKGMSEENLNAIRQGGEATRRSNSEFIQDVIRRQGLPVDPAIADVEAALKQRAAEFARQGEQVGGFPLKSQTPTTTSSEGIPPSTSYYDRFGKVAEGPATGTAVPKEDLYDLGASFTGEGFRSRFGIPPEASIKPLVDRGIIRRTPDGFYEVSSPESLNQLRQWQTRNTRKLP